MSDSSSSSSPTTSLLWFFIITTIYFVIKYYLSDPTQSKIYFGIYIVLIIIGEYIINLSLTETMCGSQQWNTALLVTLIPWIVIFGLLNIFLMIFPGWLSPFSNTFGYGVAKLMGLGNVMDNLFKLETEPVEKDNKVIAEALGHIYSDKSLLINEITTSNFDNFWKIMTPLFKSDVVGQKAIDLKTQLKSYIILKDNVAEYIWYMLTGGLVTSGGYNYVVNAGCTQSLKDMKRRNKEYNEQAEENNEKQKNETPRVYTITE